MSWPRAPKKLSSAERERRRIPFTKAGLVKITRADGTTAVARPYKADEMRQVVKGKHLQPRTVEKSDQPTGK